MYRIVSRLFQCEFFSRKFFISISLPTPNFSLAILQTPENELELIDSQIELRLRGLGDCAKHPENSGNLLSMKTPQWRMTDNQDNEICSRNVFNRPPSAAECEEELSFRFSPNFRHTNLVSLVYRKTGCLGNAGVSWEMSQHSLTSPNMDRRLLCFYNKRTG